MNTDDLENTARIDRRQAVLAQIEAALLAGRLEVEERPLRATGTDPYDRGIRTPDRPQDHWGQRRR